MGEVKMKSYYELRYHPDRRIMVKDNCGFFDITCEDMMTNRYKITSRSRSVINETHDQFKTAMIAALKAALRDLENEDKRR